jgi:choline kinase
MQQRGGRPPVVILAAGNGYRLVSREFGLPKPLFPVLGIPLIDRVLDAFSVVGFDHFVVVVGYLGDRLRAHLEASRAGCRVDFVVNREFNADNGLSVLAASAVVHSEFVLAMGDHLFEPALVEQLIEGGPEPDGITLGVDRRPEQVFDVEEATKARVDGDRVVCVGKGLTDFDGVDTGFFYAGPRLFDALDHCRREGHTKLADGVNRLAERGRVRAVDIGSARWIDVDTPQAHAEVERWLGAEPSA